MRDRLLFPLRRLERYSGDGVAPGLQGVGLRDSRRRGCEQRKVCFSPEAKCQWQSSLLRQRLSGLALVAVVKSSDLRNHNDAPAFRFLNRSRLRGVLGQCEMSSGVLVVDKVTL